MTLLGLSLESIQLLLAMWGAGLSTALGLVKFYEAFWKNRIRLTTTHSFSGGDEADTITIVNLSDAPVLVADWSLAWEPKLFNRSIGSKNQTPHEGGDRFTLKPKGEYTLSFDGPDKLDWGDDVAENRNLYLRLKVFGRRKDMKLRAA